MRGVCGTLRRIKETWWGRLASEKLPAVERATEHQNNDGQDWLDNLWSPLQNDNVQNAAKGAVRATNI